MEFQEAKACPRTVFQERRRTVGDPSVGDPWVVPLELLQERPELWEVSQEEAVVAEEAPWTRWVVQREHWEVSRGLSEESREASFPVLRV